MRSGRDRRSLEGQVALVTGGGRGIGHAISLELSGAGARVLVTGRSERELGEIVGEIVHAGGQARHLAGDVRDPLHAPAAVARAIDTWGRLDLVVANAGIAGNVAMGETGGPERAKDILDTNLFGAYLVFDAALAVIRGPGRLVAISSVLGKFGVGGQAAYCASKAGLHGLVRAVAAEVGGRGITCNAVCPGWVDTAMARARIAEIAVESKTTYEVAREEAAKGTPLGRFVEAEEVAALVAFLCSRAGDAVTGQALSVCGGATLFAG
jgi:NAD(P)-dependent dehydrogenase (short-subunit alcohol dehydrogenase family)